MVIWNFRRLCYGIPIGSWEERLNPEPMLLEIVEGLMDCVEGKCYEEYTDRACALGVCGPIER